jgi:hypothetical protein
MLVYVILAGSFYDLVSLWVALVFPRRNLIGALFRCENDCIVSWRQDVVTGCAALYPRALYGVRYTEFLSERRAMTAATVIAHRRQRTQTRTRTLYQAWKLTYTRPSAPRRRIIAVPPVAEAPQVPLAQRLHSLTTKWVQHSGSISRAANAILLKPRPDRQRYKPTKRDEHRTTKLKLRKFQHIIRTSR